MFGGVVRGTSGDTHKPTDRRTVDDGATALLAHLQQFVLHATPDAAEIDGVYPVELFAAGVGSFRDEALHTGVVERRIQTAEGRHRLVDHRLDLRLVGNITAHCDGLVTCGDELFCSRASRS